MTAGSEFLPLADDDAVNRLAAVPSLERDGHRVRTVPNGLLIAVHGCTGQSHWACGPGNRSTSSDRTTTPWKRAWESQRWLKMWELFQSAPTDPTAAIRLAKVSRPRPASRLTALVVIYKTSIRRQHRSRAWTSGHASRSFQRLGHRALRAAGGPQRHRQ
jgi:hypothetical protein